MLMGAGVKQGFCSILDSIWTCMNLVFRFVKDVSLFISFQPHFLYQVPLPLGHFTENPLLGFFPATMTQNLIQRPELGENMAEYLMF